MVTTGDEVEIREYKRLTKLNYLDRALGKEQIFVFIDEFKRWDQMITFSVRLESFDNVKPGDCFVCFSKNDIFHITRELERRGHEVAVIYGSLPPGKPTPFVRFIPK